MKNVSPRHFKTERVRPNAGLCDWYSTAAIASRLAPTGFCVLSDRYWEDINMPRPVLIHFLPAAK